MINEMKINKVYNVYPIPIYVFVCEEDVSREKCWKIQIQNVNVCTTYLFTLGTIMCCFDIITC